MKIKERILIFFDLVDKSKNFQVSILIIATISIVVYSVIKNISDNDKNVYIVCNMNKSEFSDTKPVDVNLSRHLQVYVSRIYSTVSQNENRQLFENYNEKEMTLSDVEIPSGIKIPVNFIQNAFWGKKKIINISIYINEDDIYSAYAYISGGIHKDNDLTSRIDAGDEKMKKILDETKKKYGDMATLEISSSKKSEAKKYIYSEMMNLLSKRLLEVYDPSLMGVYYGSGESEGDGIKFFLKGINSKDDEVRDKSLYRYSWWVTYKPKFDINNNRYIEELDKAEYLLKCIKNFDTSKILWQMAYINSMKSDFYENKVNMVKNKYAGSRSIRNYREFERLQLECQSNSIDLYTKSMKYSQGMDIDKLISRGYELRRIKAYDKAINDYDLVLLKNPTNTHALTNKSDVYMYALKDVNTQMKNQRISDKSRFEGNTAFNHQILLITSGKGDRATYGEIKSILFNESYNGLKKCEMLGVDSADFYASFAKISEFKTEKNNLDCIEICIFYLKSLIRDIESKEFEYCEKTKKDMMEFMARNRGKLSNIDIGDIEKKN